jgi:hypothetical protein
MEKDERMKKKKLHTLSHIPLTLTPLDYLRNEIDCSLEDRESAVGTVTGHGLDGREIGVRVPVGATFFSLRPPHRF